MKIVYCSLMLACSALLFGQGTKAGDAWRTSLPAFGEEVSKVAADAEIINAPVAITRIREFVVLTGINGEKAWVIFKYGVGKELDAALASHFEGSVSWRGEVESTESDQKEKTHTIFIKFPAPASMKKPIEFSKIGLTIPFAKLPAARVPAKGSVFSFKGQMKKDEKDVLGGNPVWVLYGLGSNSGKVEIHVSLKDVEPVL